jgi:hypothetical protein
MTVHFMNDVGQLAHYLVAFRYIPESHTGVALAKAIFEVFEEYEIVHKVS